MLVLLLSAVVCTSAAEGRVVTPDLDAQRLLGRLMEVVVEEGTRLTPEQAAAYPCFEQPTRDEPAWGFGRKTIWIRLRTAPVDDPSQWLLHAGFPRPQLIELFQRDAHGRWTKRAEGGWASPRSPGLVAHDISLPIDLAASEHLVRVEAQPARINLSLVTRTQRASQKGVELLGSGIYIGIFLGLFLYNLFLGLSLRDRAHLLYCLFLVLIALHVVTRDGFAPSDPPSSMFEHGGGLAVTSVVVLLFARRFLRLPERTGKRRFLVADRMVVALIGLSALLVLATLAGAQAAAVAAILSLVVIVVVVCSAVLVAREGDRPAAWFLLAWSVLIASCLLLVLHAFRVIDASGVANRALMVGSASEMILLSLALASRVRTLRDEKESAERSLVEARAAAQSELSGRVIEAQEKERSRFAHDLHDGLGHALLLLKQQLVNAARRQRPIPPDEATQLGADAQRCLDDARAMARNLVPASIAQLGLLAAVDGACRSVASASGVEVRLDTEGAQALETALFDDRAIHVLRVVQEALANAVRHGHPRVIRVGVTLEEDELVVCVEDDGRGLDPAVLGKGGLGLFAMEQRARLLGGSVAVRSSGGARVVLRVPLAGLLAGEP